VIQPWSDERSYREVGAKDACRNRSIRPDGEWICSRPEGHQGRHVAYVAHSSDLRDPRVAHRGDDGYCDAWGEFGVDRLEIISDLHSVFDATR
jgi:hypothetical protein